MREIKFRGRRLDNREWVYGSLIIFHDWEGNRRVQIVDDVGNIYEADPATVGQYTGLKDKDGKEIYEGDIIRCFCPETLFIDYTGIIKFKDCSFNFYHIDGDGMLRMRDFDGLAIEIMGNIHDNPELLKTE